MININAIQRVYIVGTRQNFIPLEERIRNSLHQLGRADTSKIFFYRISTDEIFIDETHPEPQDHKREVLGPVVNHLDLHSDGGLKLKQDPGFTPDPQTTLFVIDRSGKVAATLVKLLEKPWKGFPFEAQTIVV
ncbi:MAG: hypothetical protein A3I68_00800 [Candidatus Melainabacteria bacterium RIFCSPLOWO2_02_FULL_35_15]|nr:MAG: hypothetical protein A3F80_05530 [Candidatus Melainabacteria bacterium RIFCSPLOWO2_12_FULL_35_11]OGI13450.1 MAG: hypothetical protein A3I68_00800 [Candidatus Melainabacteria bacterium RIFCSPLOWO2_02_FULL_35_15]